MVPIDQKELLAYWNNQKRLKGLGRFTLRFQGINQLLNEPSVSKDIFVLKPPLKHLIGNRNVIKRKRRRYVLPRCLRFLKALKGHIGQNRNLAD